ncbi:hypothetical protein [Desulfoscipio sp. XC116]|uniref:hypothetical protein n=1 Tax=Desulfoscipio sp. XC116 TaxID=3144975 RepID=UPI00325B5558
MASHTAQGKGKAMVSAVICLVLSAIIYFYVFTNTDQLVKILKSESYAAPALCMVLVVVVAFLYGTAVSNILKYTLQERLKSQELREE